MNICYKPSCQCLCAAGVCELGGKLYCIGGWNGQVGIKQCDVFDPDTQQWSTIASLQTGMTHHKLTWLFVKFSRLLDRYMYISFSNDIVQNSFILTEIGSTAQK